MVDVIHDPAAMRDRVRRSRVAGRRVGFVPTMGALHAGHASLVDRAAAECDDVVVSIFVNPAQFAPHEDFNRYPRTLAADCHLLETHRATWVYAPEVAAVYPPDDATTVTVAGPAAGFEGTIRPGHFTGVATVVCKLLLAVPADVAYFGAKDWQQTLVVKRMVRDLGLPVTIAVCPTVRDADGLALSSRNAYLSVAERQRAVALAEALALAATMWDAGAAVAAIETAMRAALDHRGLAVDYAAVVDAESLGPIVEAAPAVALVAGRLGTTRLIDNRELPPRGGGRRAC
jgi:pantoate--beta-alanine ligase